MAISGQFHHGEEKQEFSEPLLTCLAGWPILGRHQEGRLLPALAATLAATAKAAALQVDDPTL